MPGKCLEFAKKKKKKGEKPGILIQKLEKKLKFVNMMFTYSHFKMSFTEKRSFTSISYRHYHHKQGFKVKLTLVCIAFTWK